MKGVKKKCKYGSPEKGKNKRLQYLQNKIEQV